MALGGLPVNVPLNNGRLVNIISGGTLGPNIAAFAPPAADSVRIVTAAPGSPDEFALPVTFGKGRGQWILGDLNFIQVSAEVLDPLTVVVAVANVQIVGKTFVPGPTAPFGDLVLDVHNKGAAPAAPLNLRIEDRHTGGL